MVQVKVSGVNLLLQGMDRYSDEVQRGVAEEVKDWADRVEVKAKQDVPVDTGALKSSIRAVGNPNRLSWAVKVGGINGVDYAPFVALGTGTFVDQTFLQEYGIVAYAAQFRGKGERQVNLPMRDFFFKNARTEFEKTFQNIKRLLENK